MSHSFKKSNLAVEKHFYSTWLGELCLQDYTNAVETALLRAPSKRRAER